MIVSNITAMKELTKLLSEKCYHLCFIHLKVLLLCCKCARVIFFHFSYYNSINHLSFKLSSIDYDFVVTNSLPL